MEIYIYICIYMLPLRDRPPLVLSRLRCDSTPNKTLVSCKRSIQDKDAKYCLTFKDAKYCLTFTVYDYTTPFEIQMLSIAEYSLSTTTQHRSNQDTDAKHCLIFTVYDDTTPFESRRRC